MNVERKRPIKMFKAVKAFGPYRVGDTLQPTGMYRDILLRRGLIEEVKDEPATLPHETQAALPNVDRMIREPQLATRAGKRR